MGFLVFHCGLALAVFDLLVPLPICKEFFSCKIGRMECLQFYILPYVCILRGVTIGNLSLFSMTMCYFAAFLCLYTRSSIFLFISHILFYVHVSHFPYLIRQCCVVFIFVYEVMIASALLILKIDSFYRMTLLP